MVRHKNRYMVLEISEQGKTGKDSLILQKTALHNAITTMVQHLHGDFGVASIRTGFTAKYCNEKTRTAIIRCRHGPHKFVASALPCIKSVDNKNVTVNTLYMGATIKQCFKFLQRYQQMKVDKFCIGLETDTEKQAMRATMLNLDSVLSISLLNMGPKKSQIWTHFSDETEGKVKCLYCRQTLSVKNKSTSTLIRHIHHKHPTQPISRQTVAAEAEAPVEENKGNNFESGQQSSQPPETASSSTSTIKPSQPSTARKIQTITNFFQKPLPISKQKEIDKQLICMITKEYHPFSIVEDKEFKRLLYLLNPNYKVPTRKTVSNSLIPAFYNETADLVKNRLERAFAVCLTTDGWTSRTNDSFYSVTAHYIVEEDNNTFLSSDLLGCISYIERHTAENISSKLKEVMDEWKITNKIAAIVSDNAANMKAAVRVGGWRFWGCFAHSLNLVTQSGLSEIKDVVDKIKSIVRYFKRSSHASAQLKASAERMDMPPLKLKNDVVTRWNSTYDMINRVLQMKNAIISTLAILSTSTSESNVQLKNEDWIIAEDSIKVLEIFNIITTAISSEQSISASTIIFYYKQITKHLNTFDLNTVMPQTENMIKTLKLKLKHRFQDIEDNPLITQATILDPRLKKFGFIDEEKYKQPVENLYTEVANTKLLHENPQNIIDNDITENNGEQDNQDTAHEKESLLQRLWKDFDVKFSKL